MLKFWSVINCTFVHWTKKLTLEQCPKRAHEQNHKLEKKTRQIVKVLTVPKKNFNLFSGISIPLCNDLNMHHLLISRKNMYNNYAIKKQARKQNHGLEKNLSNCNGADRAAKEFRSPLEIPLTLFIDLKGGQKLHKTVVLSRPQINWWNKGNLFSI